MTAEPKVVCWDDPWAVCSAVQWDDNLAGQWAVGSVVEMAGLWVALKVELMVAGLAEQ